MVVIKVLLKVIKKLVFVVVLIGKSEIVICFGVNNFIKEIKVIGISFIINVVDWIKEVIFVFNKLIMVILVFVRMVIGINKFVDRWNKLISCVLKIMDNVEMLVG